jgi:hypothetical protein
MMGGRHMKVEGALRKRAPLPDWFASARKEARTMDWSRLMDWEEYMSVLQAGENSSLSHSIDRSAINMLVYVCFIDNLEGLSDEELPRMTVSQVLYREPLSLVRFFNAMALSKMNGSTRANFARTAKKVTKAVIRGLIRIPSDLKRNAEIVYEQLKRTIRELDTAKNRVTIERRNPIKQKSLGNPRFIDLERHKKVFELARKKLNQLIALQEDTPMWRYLFCCWFNFVLFEVPVRPSFYAECTVNDVESWMTESGQLQWAIRPQYEKSLGLQKTARDYFFIPEQLTKIFTFYMETGRDLLKLAGLKGKSQQGAPEALLLNEVGQPLHKDRFSLWFRKCMWEITRHLAKSGNNGVELLTNLREYRYLFSVSVLHSDVSEKDFIAQQLRHSKTG